MNFNAIVFALFLRRRFSYFDMQNIAIFVLSYFGIIIFRLAVLLSAWCFIFRYWLGDIIRFSL